MLIRILQEPKNSLVKQYEHLFSLDGVEIQFTNDALRAVAQKAIANKTGARGLRAIMEEVLNEIMFTAPSDSTIEKIIVNKNAIEDSSEIKIMHDSKRKSSNKVS